MWTPGPHNIAWKINIKGLPPATVAAPTRNKARYIAHIGAMEAGYDVAWTEIRATRWPESDQWAASERSRRCANPEDVDEWLDVWWLPEQHA
jgi:hypothetical protein